MSPRRCLYCDDGLARICTCGEDDGPPYAAVNAAAVVRDSCPVCGALDSDGEACPECQRAGS